MIKSSLFQIKETTAMFFSGSERKYRYILPKNQEFLQPLVMDQKVDNLGKSWNYVDIPLENTNNEEEKANKCNQCKFASSLKSSLRRHLKMHSGERSNKCNQCDYSSFEAGDLRRHLKMHKSQTNATSAQCVKPLRNWEIKK